MTPTQLVRFSCVTFVPSGIRASAACQGLCALRSGQAGKGRGQRKANPSSTDSAEIQFRIPKIEKRAWLRSTGRRTAAVLSRSGSASASRDWYECAMPVRKSVPLRLGGQPRIRPRLQRLSSAGDFKTCLVDYSPSFRNRFFTSLKWKSSEHSFSSSPVLKCLATSGSALSWLRKSASSRPACLACQVFMALRWTSS